MLSSVLSADGGKCLMISYVMRSGPGALLLFVLLSVFCSSSGVMSVVSS